MLINKKHVKALVLAVSQECRGGKFSRVSKGFLQDLDGKVKNIIRDHVRQHPSVGKTIY